MSQGRWLAGLVVLVALVAVAAPGWCQAGGPPPPPAPPGGFGGPLGGQGVGFMAMAMPMSPPATVIVQDGVVYVACNGKLTAYEAKTLAVLAEVTYWTPPPMPMGMMGVQARPAGPPPAAP